LNDRELWSINRRGYQQLLITSFFVVHISVYPCITTVYNFVEIMFLSLSNYYPEKFDTVPYTCYICIYHVSDKESL